MMIHNCGSRVSRMASIGEIDPEIVNNLAEELDANPQLWNVHDYRTSNPGSPHREVDDIWVRYNDIKNLKADELDGSTLVPTSFNERHTSVWYPAADILLNVRAAVYESAKLIGATHIGGVLITRIPPGKQVYPHADNGWHAEHYNRKLVVVVRGSIKQQFCFQNEEMHAEPGDVFEFDNSHTHWVLNKTAVERISLIVTTRTEM